MAATAFSLLAAAISFSLLLPYALSRSTPESTTSLLVSDSLQQTVRVLSFDPSSTLPEEYQYDGRSSIDESSNSSSSSFSVPVHPRAAVMKSEHKGYKSLVLSRLRRDSARVTSLNTKLQLALADVNTSELRPVYSEIRPEQLTTPITSGTSQGSGEYFARLGVGSPTKQFYMVIDTGSDINWLQCQPCTDCYQQTDPIFNPAGSSTYRPLSCDSAQCNSLEVSACRSGRCLYQVSYGDGSYTVGDFATDTVSIGRSGSINGVALGCGHDNEGLFVGAAGLMGLGGGPLSITSQIKATSFSYCLVDRDTAASSSLDFNTAPPGDSVTAPLTRNKKIDTFYYVGLTGFSVGGRPVGIPPELFQVDESGRGGIIVDCGTAITRLRTEAYNAIRDAFVGMTQSLPRAAGVALFDTCYDLSGRTSVRVPTVALRFAGGKSLDLPAKNFLIPVDSTGTFCFAFAPTSSPLSIIGNVQQQGTRVTYDLANNRVGFSSNKC